MEDFLAKVVAYAIVVVASILLFAIEIAPPYIAWRRTRDFKKTLKVVLFCIFLTPIGGFIASFTVSRPAEKRKSEGAGMREKGTLRYGEG